MGSSSNLLSSQRVAAAPSPSRPWPQTPRSARQRLRQRAPRQSSQHRLETVDKRDAHGRFPERLALSRWSPSQIALAEQLAAQASAASFSPTKKPAALYARRALLRHKLKTGEALARQQHRVDDVDDAVRLHHVLDGDLGGVAFGVPHPDRAVFDLDGEILTFDGLKHGLATALLDRRHQILGGETARNDV